MLKTTAAVASPALRVVVQDQAQRRDEDAAGLDVPGRPLLRRHAATVWRKKINGRQEETTDAAIPPPPGATTRDQEPSLSLRPPAGPGPETVLMETSTLRSMKIEQELLVTNVPPAGAMAHERPAAARN